MMKVIGVTGGVGAGKSCVLDFLEDNYNCVIIKADDVAKSLYAKNKAAYKPIVKLLSSAVLDDDEEIDFKKMAALIFKDEKLRTEVNAVVHPLVKKTIKKEIDKNREKGTRDFVFLEAALLIEDNYEVMLDELWYIFASENVRRERLSSSRMYTDEKITGIFNSQLSDKVFREHASFVIDNSADPQNTFDQIRKKMTAFTMTKEERAKKVIELLKKEYPESVCTLDYDDAWKLLVSVRLAAQCTDARVNETVPELFDKYPGVKQLAEANADDIEKIVKPCGLGKTKARDIKLCMQALLDRFDGKVPDDMDSLLSLPGVGRKSANLIMGDIFGKPAIVTDTHCIRLANRIGLVDNEKDAKKVEMELWKIIPEKESNSFCHRLVDHGRAVCNARVPYCKECVLEGVCMKNI